MRTEMSLANRKYFDDMEALAVLLMLPLQLGDLLADIIQFLDASELS